MSKGEKYFREQKEEAQKKHREKKRQVREKEEEKVALIKTDWQKIKVDGMDKNREDRLKSLEKEYPGLYPKTHRKGIKKEIKDGIIADPMAIDQEMMLDPEGSGGMRPVDPTQLGATEGEPDAALRSMDVDAKATTMDANIVKPKGGEI